MPVFRRRHERCAQTFRTAISRGEGALSQLQRAVTELQKTATESTERPSTPSGVTAVQVVEPPVDFSNFVWLGSQGALTFAGSAALVFFLIYFLLASGDLFKRKLVRMSGDRLSQRKITLQMIDQIGERVAKSMFHLIVAGIVVGVCTWALLTSFGVRYAGLWGLAAGLLNCVPYLGPAAVAAGLFLASLLQFGNIATAAMVAGISLDGHHARRVSVHADRLRAIRSSSIQLRCSFRSCSGAGCGASPACCWRCRS